VSDLGISCGVINARFVKPLDSQMILAAAAYGPIITVEENVLQGGFGSAVLELLHDQGMIRHPVKRLGIGDRFIEQGPQDQLRHDVGIDHDGIVQAIQSLVGR
ncbi:MAG: transketolase C-terminal domain-containing protein, partial [Trichlorobacter sp.]